MPESERQKMIRQYAAGDITWRVLRESGFENYVEVLAALAQHAPADIASGILPDHFLPLAFGHGLFLLQKS